MFARDLGCVCVNVDYRLAPEYAFPTGVLDAWDAVCVKGRSMVTALTVTGQMGGSNSIAIV